MKEIPKKVQLSSNPILDTEQLRIDALAKAQKERFIKIANEIISLLAKDESITTEEVPTIFQTASSILAQKMNKSTVKTIKELK